MSLSEKVVLGTYDMERQAMGLANFLCDQVVYNTEYSDPVVYVMGEDGRHVIGAKFEEVTLTDGSKVYNLVLKMED